MTSLARRNLIVVTGLLFVLGGMTALVSQAPTLYRLFCSVTGFGGTAQRTAVAVVNASQAQAMPSVTVRFNSDVNGDLPWSFYPLQREVTARIGVPQTIYYRAVNHSSKRVTAHAVFDVTPYQAGPYFDKIECFCFTQQTLEPGQSVDMAVRFFVDPDMLKDPDGSTYKTLTLSYTFFRAKDQAEGQTQASAGAAAKSVN